MGTKLGSAALPARYMQTIENAAVWAQIGDKMVTVGIHVEH